MMKKTVRWIGTCGVALALAGSLNACAGTPTVQGQSGSVTDPRPNQGTALDQVLLRDVDAAIAARKRAGTNSEVAQKLRDSAVDLAGKGLYEEANGNLKSAAVQVGVLAGINGSAPIAAQVIPNAPAAQAATRGENSLLNVTFTDASSISGWSLVGPKIPDGKPLWEVRDGKLVQRGVEGVITSDEATGLVTGDPAWSDVTVATSVFARDTKEVGLIVRQTGESYYRLRALVVGTGKNTGNYILERVVDGEVSKLATFDGAELSASTWHTLSFSAQGSKLSVSVDGTALGSAEDATLSKGRVGVSTLAMSGAYFANLQVTGR